MTFHILLKSMLVFSALIVFVPSLMNARLQPPSQPPLPPGVSPSSLPLCTTPPTTSPCTVPPNEGHPPSQAQIQSDIAKHRPANTSTNVIAILLNESNLVLPVIVLNHTNTTETDRLPNGTIKTFDLQTPLDKAHGDICKVPANLRVESVLCLPEDKNLTNKFNPLPPLPIESGSGSGKASK